MIGISRLAEIKGVPGVRLTAGTSPQKRALVIVRNSDGTFNREVSLSSAQYAALAQPGAGAPPGVMTEEWTSGRAVAYGKDFDLGDAEVNNGHLMICHAMQTVNGQTEEHYLSFAPGEWSGTLSTASVDPTLLASMPIRGAGRRPISVHAGIVVS